MLELLEKELSIHGIKVLPQGFIEVEGMGKMPIQTAISAFKKKARNAYGIVSKLWTDLADTLESSVPSNSPPTEGIENIFVYAVQGLKRAVALYPGLSDFERVDAALCRTLCSDTKSVSYKTMSKVIEYKLAIEWVGHIISRNLYIRSMLVQFYALRRKKPETVAKGVHGPFSNLDLPMKERVFEWSEIDEEVAGRDRDIKNQSRYKKGLEGYNDPSINEGQVWRELKNEPFLWGKEGENPYPHRNTLWS
jgi:hypothetical protein